MRAELIDAVDNELKRFKADLNLSDAQKTQLKTALEKAHDRVDEIKENNPEVTRADVISKLKEYRVELRERVETFLTPEQLTKWDDEVTKARSFLGHSVEA